MTSATLPSGAVRAEYENEVLRQNVKELQQQLQESFIRIRELVEREQTKCL